VTVADLAIVNRLNRIGDLAIVNRLNRMGDRKIGNRQTVSQFSISHLAM
jgi:hypothetical protein